MLGPGAAPALREREGRSSATLVRMTGHGPATALFCLAALSVGAAVAFAQPSERDTTVLPLALTVADHEGAPVVDDAWLDEQVANANALFAPHGVSFRVVERHMMDGSHARLEDRGDRHVLGHLLHPQRIDCFFVLSLRDVDDRSRYRQGVHWRPRGEAYPERAHFVIVSSIAGPTVLAHELGHYFGNRHSDVPGNIMSYERGDGPPFFDDDQGRRIRFSLRRFLRREELVTAGALARSDGD